MKASSLVFSLLLVLSGTVLGQERFPSSVKNEVLIKFRTALNDSAAREFVRKQKGELLEKLGDTGWQRVRLPANLSVTSAVDRFGWSQDVEAVQPNFYYRLLATPNDPHFGSLWGMTRISAPGAWDLNTGSESVVVANIDTGIKYDHEDLSANMWKNSGEIPGNGIDDDGNGFVDDYYGYDFFFNDPDPMDEHGHGTHTAGTLGAVGNNGVGVVGVNWNVRIMAIKIYDSTGYGTTSSMLINAYNYVRMMKERGVNIKVTNNSYGGCDEACGFDQATKDAIDALGRAGILQVFAAGNNGANSDINPLYPAAYNSPWIVSVANSNTIDDRNTTSNYGPLSVDLASPGTGILSTWLSPGNYATFSGTSMAAPHVAGAVALIAAHHPTLSAASIKATVLNTVDPLAQWTGVVRSGGRLNVAQAISDPTICEFVFPTSNIDLPTKGGHFSLTVTSAPNCDFQAKSNVNWIRVAGADSFSGGGMPIFRATVNPTISRSGTISIAGQTINVIQSRN
ncbi:MAG TPA: S8 family serine peptidase [Pyrinomonadaceae bacterium]|nr:S8 family serine peptidase [Pyrinomonadaceae bacterium]